MRALFPVIALILLSSLFVAAQTTSGANSDIMAVQDRMFFPHDMFWGWAQLELAPPHNEIDAEPLRCNGKGFRWRECSLQYVRAVYVVGNARSSAIWPHPVAALHAFWCAGVPVR